MTRWIFLGLGLIALGVQCWGLYAPRPVDSAPEVPGLDKVVHLVFFAVPVWLLLRARVGTALVVAVFVVQAIFSEYAQWRWIPNRGGDPWDAAADLAGIALGVLLRKGVRATAGSDRPSRRTR